MGERGGGVCVGFLKRTRRRDKERYSKHILFSSSLSSFDFASFFYFIFLFVFLNVIQLSAKELIV